MDESETNDSENFCNWVITTPIKETYNIDCLGTKDSPVCASEEPPAIKQRIRLTPLTRRRAALIKSACRVFPHTYQPGDNVEVLSSGIWCPASIVEIVDNKTTCGLRVHYVGWPVTYDEIICSEWKIDKPGSQVLVLKAWIHLPGGNPAWPCLVYARSALLGNDDAIEHLKKEKKIFVRLCGSATKSTEKWFGGKWLEAKAIQPFSTNFHTNFARGMLLNNKKLIKTWRTAIAELCMLDILDGFETLDQDFLLNGTLSS